MSKSNYKLESFHILPDDFRNAVELIQKQLEENIDSLDLRIVELNSDYRTRKMAALVLKIFSVLSSVIITIGFLDKLFVQVLGGLITAIAGIERAFANMKRLLAIAAAKGAYERIRRQVVARHNNMIIEVVKYRDRDPEKSAELLIKFVGELRDSLAETRDRIETDLHDNDYENLGRLNLEEQHPSSKD